MDTTNIGKKIRQLRINYGLTLEQVSVSLGIKKNMLSYYELGKSSISAELLTKIADYYGVTLDFFTANKSVLHESNSDETESYNVYMKLHSDDFNDIRNKREILYDITLPALYFDSGDYFGIKITDESLNLKGFHKGSVAIAKKQKVAKQGDLIIYIYGDQSAHYGLYSRNDENIIISPCSDDKTFTPKAFDISDPQFKILGKISFIFGHII